MKIENSGGFNEHAMLRMAQRNLSPSEVEAVIYFGRELHRTGATFYFLGKRDLPEGAEKQLERLVGATVILQDDEVLTGYRNKRAIRKIKRKRKHKIVVN